MKTRYFGILTVLFALFAGNFISCSDEYSQAVNQQRIYTIYELYYNGNTDKTHARATFKFGNSVGTLMKLEENSKIAFTPADTSRMHTLSFQPETAVYQRIYQGYLEAGSFLFTDANGKTYENHVHTVPADFPDSLPRIVMGESCSFPWVGSPLDKEENITLKINNPDNMDALSFFRGTEGASNFLLTADKTAQLSEGEKILTLDHRYQPEDINTPSAGGSVTGRYRPKSQNITPVPE